MILIDYSALAISSLFSGGIDTSQPLSESFLRHMILNIVRAHNVKFRNDYGETVICCDGGSWRKKAFPNYKAHRASAREESSIDWKEFFRIMGIIEEEIRQFIPMKIIRIPGAEADDIIATLVESTQEFGRGENVMIVASDKDFIQLQKYSSVKQYSPILKKMLIEKNPIRALQEKVLRGDAGDGVPNVLSDDAVLITEGMRQTPLTSKKLDAMLQVWPNVSSDAAILKNFERNRTCIDFTCIPVEIKEAIMTTFNSSIIPQKSGILNYLITRRLSNLTSCASDFFPSAA